MSSEMVLLDTVEGRVQISYDTDEYREALVDAAEDIESRMVTAYALTWDTLIPARTKEDRACWVYYTPRSFDAMFAEPEEEANESAPLVMLGHGDEDNRHRRDGRRVTRPIRTPIGQVVHFREDATGLLTTALYDPTPEARAVVADIRDGFLPWYSCHTIPQQVQQVDERNGRPVYAITEAWLVEVGPTTSPADLEARALTIGGEAVEARAGLEDEELDDRARGWWSGILSDPDSLRLVERVRTAKQRAAEDAVTTAMANARVLGLYAAVGNKVAARSAYEELRHFGDDNIRSLLESVAPRGRW